MVLCKEVMLVPPDDLGYLSKSARMAKIATGLKTRDPVSSDYTKILNILENSCRKVLDRYFHSTDCRILKYSLWKENHAGYYHYRELDYVSMIDSFPGIFFEFKFKEQFTGKFSKGFKQLETSLMYANEAWPNLAGICLHFFLGAVLGLVSEEPDQLYSLEQIPEVIDNAKSYEILGLWLSGTELINAAVSLDYLSADIFEELRKTRSAKIDPYILIDQKKDDGFGSLGRWFQP